MQGASKLLKKGRKALFQQPARLRLIIGLLTVLTPPAATGDVEVLEVRVGQPVSAQDRVAIEYPVAVLQGAGWEISRLRQAVKTAEAVFRRCGVTITASAFYRLNAPEVGEELVESMQEQVLAKLPPDRPLAVFVNRTADHDTAYSYLLSAPVSSRGTVWITRDVHPGCSGVLLAHELGHILLDTAGHSRDPDNLMSPTCTVSNVRGSRPGADLTASQCRKLRDRVRRSSLSTQ